MTLVLMVKEEAEKAFPALALGFSPIPGLTQLDSGATQRSYP